MTGVANCTPRESFVGLVLEHAILVRSNLGGKGGRCTSHVLCEEIQDATTLHEIFIRNVGINGQAQSIARVRPEPVCTLLSADSLRGCCSCGRSHGHIYS